MKTKLSRVDAVLQRRRHASNSLRGAFWVSVLIHGLGIGAMLVIPLLAKEKAKPIEFVSVAIVPSQALGVRNPDPAPPDRAPESRAPEPAPEAPAPEPQPPEPKLPEPEEPTPSPTRTPAPTRPPENRTSPTPSSDTPRDSRPSTPELRRREGSPTGSSTGTSTFGGRVGFDNPNFKHSYYIDRMTGMLSAQWDRPGGDPALVALVHFVIEKGGAVRDTRIVESSGNSAFDLATMRAVLQANPFPPLPPTFTDPQLGVTVEFR